MKVVAIAGIFTALTAVPLFSCGGFFEEAPPTLDVYLDCLPGKSLGQIFVETSTSPIYKSPASVSEIVKIISERAKTEPSNKLIAEVDTLLAAVRATSGDHDGLALLHDLRDALASAPSECAAYIQWRLSHPLKPLANPDPYAFSPPPPTLPPSELTEVITKKAADSTDPMRAHWLYLRGALSFNYGDKVEAQKWFDRVADEFPNHPRAEIALFMSGRCLLAQSREEADYNTSQEERARIASRSKAKHIDAIARFRMYLERFPHGRFIADAYGWLGALDLGIVSLDDYIRQVETPGHPEVLKSGVMMIQKRLDELASDSQEGEKAIELVAKHPKVAMSMLYLVLGKSSDEHGIQPDGAFRIAQTKKWRNSILPKLAAAVAAQKDLYVPRDIWQPRYVSILAQAASNAGNQSDALKLTAMLPRGLERSDDLLFARAIALQRAGRTSESIAAFQLFLRRFPSSPLAKGARVKLGIALRDHHESGRAVVELKKLLEINLDGASYSDSCYPPGDAELKLTDSPIRPDISNAENDQVRQVIDTILNFAPLSELAVALREKDGDPKSSDDLKAIIIARALAYEDFATARKFMTPEEFATRAEELAALTAKVKVTTDPKEKARFEARLGDAWAARRGMLLKLKGLSADFRSQPELAEINRRINGKAMDFRQVESELDDRDELRHASRWWLRAARSNSASPLSAACRLKALEAISKVAAQSAYAFQRAIEEGISDASREIYNRLQTESPGAKEALQAAYWTFQPPRGTSLPAGKLRAPERYSSYENRMRRTGGYYWGDYQLLGEDASSQEYNPGDPKIWSPINERVNQLRDTNLSVSDLFKVCPWSGTSLKVDPIS